MSTTPADGALPAQGRFTKKPITIEAAQWFKNGDHPQDYSKDHDGLEGGELRIFTGAERKANEWEGDVVRYFRRPDVSGDTPCKHCGIRMHEHGWIDTLEGGHIVCPGDWIITGIKGEHYPCKNDVFAATYDLADRATRADGWISVQTLPEPQKPVLLDIGKKYPIRAMWVAANSLETGLDASEDFGEYDEATGSYYCPAGWYEWNEHEETHWLVSSPPIAWWPLPAPPLPSDKEAA